MTEFGLNMLKRHEGLRLTAYHCPSGILTVGYGHTKGVTKGETITEEEAGDLLTLDVAIAEADARRLMDNFDTHSPRRQDALINMAFNLGYNHFRLFHDFLGLFRQGKYVAAAEDLRHTLWYKQVKGRAREIAAAIKEG